MAEDINLEFRAGGSLFDDLAKMQASVAGLGEVHKQVHGEIQGDLKASAESATKFGASVSAASQLVVALAKSAGQGLPSLAKSLQEVADLTDQARAGLSATDRTNLNNVNAALRDIASSQGIIVRTIGAEKKARIEALVEAKKITAEEGKLLESVTEVVDTLKEATAEASNLPAAIAPAVEQGATLAQQYRAAVLEAQRIGQEFGTNSEQFLEATQRAAQLKKEITDVGDRIKALNPGDKLAAFTQFGNAIASGAQAVGGFFVTFANGNQAIQETIFKFQSFLFAIQGAQSFIRDFKDAFDNVRAVLGLTTAATEASTIASEIDAVARGEQAVATTAVGTSSAAATTGIRAFTASLLANPIFAAVAVLGSLAGALIFFTSQVEAATETYDDLLERLDRPVRLERAKAEAEAAKLAADLEKERLQRVKDYEEGRRASAERTRDEVERDAKRQEDIERRLLGTQLNSLDSQRVAFQSLQETKRRAVETDQDGRITEVRDTVALTTLKKKLGLEESATLIEVSKAYYDAKAQFRETEAQSESEASQRRADLARAEADRIQEQIEAEQAAAELRLRVRESLAEQLEAIERELKEKIAALEIEQADPREQLRLRKAAADEEVNLLEQNLRRQAALEELRVKIGAEALDKLTDRQRQAAADRIIAEGGGRLSIEQEQQFNTLRLLTEQGFIKESQELERANLETLLTIQAEGADRQRQQLELDLVARAEVLRKAGATEAQIVQDADRQRFELNQKLAEEALSLEEQTQVDLIEARTAGGRGNAAAERAAQIEILSVRLEFAQRALALIKDDGSAEAAARIAAAKKTVADLTQQLNAVKAQVVPFSLFDLLGLEVSDAERQQIEQAFQQIGASLVSLVQSNIAARQADLENQKAVNEERISDTQNRIQELEAQLREEEDLQRQGLANNVDAIKQQIEEKKRIEAEALAERKRIAKEEAKLARERAIAESAQQASSLLTAAATLFQKGAFQFPGGIIAAIGTIAGMLASFVAIKNRIAQASAPQAFFKGTKRVRREAGQPTGIDTIPAMLTEDEAVVPVAQNRRHAGLVGAIIDDDFSGLTERDLKPILDAIDLRPLLEGTGVKLKESALREAVAIHERSVATPAVDVRGLESRLDSLTSEVAGLRKDQREKPETTVLADGTRITRRPGEIRIDRP